MTDAAEERTAGIACETWKRTIYEKHLKRVGLAISEEPKELLHGLLMLRVKLTVDQLDNLQDAIVGAGVEAAKLGAPNQ